MLLAEAEEDEAVVLDCVVVVPELNEVVGEALLLDEVLVVVVFDGGAAGGCSLTSRNCCTNMVFLFTSRS